MKPPQFSYADPDSLAATIDLLAEHGDGAKVLAGGQSLIPLLNFRLARPELLVDINRVPELRTLEAGSGGVRVGATVRQRELERTPGLRAANPLLAEAIPLMGHFQIRNRGTVCGCLAHADPAAELPAVALALDAELSLVSRRGHRAVSAGEFFVSYLTTIMQPDELLAEVAFPAWRDGDGWAIEELVRREGDFALVGIVARLSADAGACTGARIVAFGMGGRPQEMTAAEEALRGERLDERAISGAVERVRSDAEAEGDIHASAEYRSYVAGTLAGRAIARAWDRAGAARDAPGDGR